ncbi:aldehyde dehydrogenase [Pullulanibacillus camelliae]|uniref:Aldehyde dehydrogenase n=1 Tax=Pullulanibacillus camelliae TaxID=1707096 RepID=A0A8J2VK22_9BACL|nr:aldehyde dehydrogenase [Pullulanibacillus camelliae]GGE27707.1 aldehyde dehydrogenase [Pullulanibacillus camelliae]
MKKMKMYIDGQWVESGNHEYLSSVNPFNREVWATVPQASQQDANDAIEAARRSFHTNWKHSSGLKRATLLFKLADLLDENAEHLAQIESKDNGKIIRETTKQMHFAARMYRFYAGYADKLYGESIPLDNTNLLDYTMREPIGVAVLITAWNSPIQLLANKLAPALAAGNCVVIKPSEQASVSTLEFTKLIEAAGFPQGVVNIVTGDGRVGDYLTRSDKVNKISFTGGVHTARLIGNNASKNFVPLTLELGGKSPNIIYSDADLERAVPGAMAGIFASSGQTCIAGSRLLVQRSIYDEVATKIAKRVQTIKLGDPLDPLTEMGPVANEGQYHRILKTIEKVESEGAKVLVGGEIHDPELSTGYYISPTVLINVSNAMEVAREEVFGPVLCMIPFEDEEESIQIANDSGYGLASGIWTNNLSRAHRIAKELEAGTVWVNTYRTSAAQAPFGGVKQSGYGRERGFHALQEYTRTKNVMVDLSNEIQDPFSIRT